jgi:hypothetical protein
MLYCACCSNPLNDGCVETTIPTFSDDDWTVQICYSCHWFSPTSHSEIRHVNAVSVFLVDGSLQESARCLDCTDVPCPKHALAAAKSQARSKLQMTRSGDGISRPVTHEEHVMATKYHMRIYQEYMDYHKSHGSVVFGGGGVGGDASMVDTTDNEVDDDENWEEYFRTIHPRVDDVDDEAVEENGVEQKCSICNAPFPWHDRCANCESQSLDVADDPPERDADDARCLACNAPTGAAWSTHCWPECPRDNMTSPDSILAELSAVERQPLQLKESNRAKSAGGQTRTLDPDWEVESEMRASKRIRTAFSACGNCGGTWGSWCEECAFVRRSMASKKEGSMGSPVKMLL